MGEIERKEQGKQSDSIELHAFDLIPNFQANLFTYQATESCTCQNKDEGHLKYVSLDYNVPVTLMVLNY